jgi:cytochrome d ubiquinol oxidase subunit I
VQGLLRTQDGNSPSVSLTEVALSLGTFVILYLALGIVWAVLMLRFAKRPLEPGPEPSDGDDDLSLTPTPALASEVY